MKRLLLIILLFGIKQVNSQCSPPTVTVSNSIICAGHTTTLSASGATSYTWSPGGANTAVITVSPGVTTTYTVIGNTGTCTASTSVTITVNPLPIISCNANPDTIAPGASTQLNSSFSGTAFPYSCMWAPAGTVSCANCFTTVATPLASTCYTIDITDANACSAFCSICVVVSATLNINEYRNNKSAFIFPNPNSGSFKLQIDNEIENGELILFNSLGQKVHEQKIIQGENNIITDGLRNGLYHYLLLQNKHQITSGKVVIED